MSTGTELRDASGIRRRWTKTVWTQDNTALPYPQNPRVTGTKTYDDADGNGTADNTRRTSISYVVYNGATTNLPYEVREYAADGTTVYRTTRTDYRFDPAYIQRNIWGLPAARMVYAGDSNNGAMLARTVYDYDWGGEHLEVTPAGVNIIGHDTDYNINYRSGRGNLTFIGRMDATDPENGGKMQQSKVGFDTLGNVRFTRDHLWHVTDYFYEDRTVAGYTNAATQTLAYPTSTLGVWERTQSGQPRSYVGYNYDTGQATKTEGVAPAGKTRGAVQLFYYDSVYRLQKQLLDNTGAYASYEYATTLDKVTTYTKREDNSEIVSETRTDGAGRTVSVKSEHPNSAGNAPNRFMGQIFIYDVMGRAWKTSHPAEVDAAGAPAGDDAYWYWTEQA